MNNCKAISTIKSILKDNDRDRICILIDGQWGIGKTYTMNKVIENNNLKLNYVSVFGKQDLKEIEKDIIMQLLLGSKVNNKLSNSNTIKIVSNMLSDVAKQFTGVNSDIIRTISVESVSSEENSIICIDDLERKANKININDLLGLIERASTNFNIIIIANTSQFNKEELDNFNRFKEKVIDYEIIIDQLSDDTLKKILGDKFGDIDRDIKDKIVETFKKNNTSLNNLRIYKKYINLIYKVNMEVDIILNSKEFRIDDKMIELCNRIVVDNYTNFDKDTKTKKNSLDYRSQQLKDVIEKIFKYEEYDKSILKEYCKAFSQIQKDINSFYNLYKLSREDAYLISDRIIESIESENKEYFIEQKYIIALYDVLCEIGIIDSFKSGLVKMAEKLYEPKIDQKPQQFNIEDYNTFDPIGGEQENYNVVSIINYINEYNKKVYNKLKEERLITTIDSSNIDEINEVLKYFSSISIDDFKKIYFISVKILSDGYDDTAWKVLCKIIDKTDSSLVEEFLRNEKNNKKNGIGQTIISNVRLKALIDILEEKKYFEHQMEYQRECYEQMQDDMGEEYV